MRNRTISSASVAGWLLIACLTAATAWTTAACGDETAAADAAPGGPDGSNPGGPDGSTPGPDGSNPGGPDGSSPAEELPETFTRGDNTYALNWVEHFDRGLGEASVGDWTFETNAAYLYPGNVAVDDGALQLKLTARGNEQVDTDRDYLGAEYDRNGEQLFGRFLTRMKPAAPAGVISSFFTAFYTFSPGGELTETAELDIEFVGDTNEVELTVHWVDAQGVKRESGDAIALPFDAAADYHVYEIEWLADRIVWYADGVELHRFDDPAVVPELALPQAVMANTWITTSVEWGGPFDPAVLPIASQYDWMASYTLVR